MSERGVVRKIYLRSEKRTPVTSVESAVADCGSGLRGDHKKGGKRQVTILSLESWRAACDELGVDVDPSLRRANVLTEGVDLREAIGRKLVLGEVHIEVLGETDPCDRMDEASPGLKEALKPELRGGVFGRVVQPGTIDLGAAAYLEG